MKLHLRNFRRWNDTAIDMDTGVVKMTGNSGCGKTTIFEAIYWCLYGKVRNVSPKGVVGAKTEVTMDIDVVMPDGSMIKDVRITRQGMKKVTIHLGSNVYGDDEAQGYIDGIFGTSDMFMLTSYLRAESVHPLITGSPADRREMTSLIFPDASKYDMYKGKLMLIRRKDQDALIAERSKLIAYQERMLVLEGIARDQWDINILEYQPTTIGADVTKELAEISKKRALASKHYAQWQSLVSLDTTTPIDVDAKQVMQDELSFLKGRLMQSNIQDSTKAKVLASIQERMDKEKAAIASLLSSVGLNDLTPKEAEKIISILNELLSIATSSSDLDTKIKQVKDEFNMKATSLVAAEKVLEDMDYNYRLESILECPSCKAKLVHADEQLAMYNGDTAPRVVEHPVSVTDVQKMRIRVDRLEHEKNKLRDDYNRFNDILNRESQQVKGVSLGTLDLKAYKEKMLEYLSLNREHTNSIAAFNRINDDNREYISKDEAKELKAKADILEASLTSMRSREMHIAMVEKQKAAILAQAPWLANDPEAYVVSLDTQMVTLEVQSRDAKRAQDMNKIHIQYQRGIALIDACTKAIQSLDQRLQTAARLEALLQQAYMQYVGDKLKDIEYDVSMLGKLFFDETMNISLIAGTSKASFDMQVEYAGISFDDIKAMSTGERKRLSIILMMILSKHTSSQMMLLDEAFTSIGMDSRGIILNEVTKMGIPVYLTCHDEIPGITSEIPIA